MKVRVAVVQAGSVILDRAASLAKAVEWLKRAGKNCRGGLVVFPEAFVPGYPRGLGFGTVVGMRQAEGRELWRRYWEQGVDVPGPVTETLGEAAREAGVYLAIGVVEREGHTLYCTLLYFGPDGKLLAKHRKLKPTAAERLIWGEGDGSTLAVVQAEWGRMGGLICWENLMPLARMAMYAQGLDIWLAPTADDREPWQSTLRHIAYEGRCYVIGANQFVNKGMYPPEVRAVDGLGALKGETVSRGGSAIVGPLGHYVAGPLWDEEGILEAELDVGEVSRARFDFDVAGHYARADVFELRVDKRARPAVSEGTSGEGRE